MAYRNHSAFLSKYLQNYSFAFPLKITIPFFLNFLTGSAEGAATFSAGFTSLEVTAFLGAAGFLGTAGFWETPAASAT